MPSMNHRTCLLLEVSRLAADLDDWEMRNIYRTIAGLSDADVVDVVTSNQPLIVGYTLSGVPTIILGREPEDE